MIEFHSLDPSEKDRYNDILQNSGKRGCEYGFTNLYMWGRQKIAYLADHVVYFSQFNRKSVYLFPMGAGDQKPVLDAVIQDAKDRGIPCRFTGLSQEDCALLEQLYPGQFRYHTDRDSFDYVYDINDLADLKGRRFQKKRNHLNRFRAERPSCKLLPITEETLPRVQAMAQQWYDLRLLENPHGDYQMEQAALNKALRHYEQLGLEGLYLEEDGLILAFAIGSKLKSDTFDIHFEKALNPNDGTYAAINQGFAAYLREKYPEVAFLDREEDMGLEGLRKAKLSYCPDHMVEKSWACLLEDGYDY